MVATGCSWMRRYLLAFIAGWMNRQQEEAI
jgi:hypothetical protein